ncbi:hypothetical protein [Limnohabitans sp. Hippo4]|uniref:hypothetical protein n=1 Tax=Limnohabitans sp. Hippo4 TaxID=1826167 RepID=UPI0011B26651|nr:hypothetical protein [Limnohabitans sp. Hippo4]
METIFAIGLCVAALYLITRRWIWILFFGISGLAAAFSTLASIFHFQILGALGFCFLAWICFVITAVIADGYK